MDLAVAEGQIYWADRAISGDIVSTAVAGGPPTTLWSVDAPGGLAVGGGRVYWTGNGDGTVMSLPTGGGGVPSTVATGLPEPGPIAVDDTQAYWVTDTGAVMSVPFAGGTPATLATGASATAIAVDATSVYWFGQDGSLNRLTPK